MELLHFALEFGQRQSPSRFYGNRVTILEGSGVQIIAFSGGKNSKTPSVSTPTI